MRKMRYPSQIQAADDSALDDLHEACLLKVIQPPLPVLIHNAYLLLRQLEPTRLAFFMAGFTLFVGGLGVSVRRTHLQPPLIRTIFSM